MVKYLGRKSLAWLMNSPGKFNSPRTIGRCMQISNSPKRIPMKFVKLHVQLHFPPCLCIMQRPLNISTTSASAEKMSLSPNLSVQFILRSNKIFLQNFKLSNLSKCIYIEVSSIKKKKKNIEINFRR